jgi:hypothetical protein
MTDRIKAWTAFLVTAGSVLTMLMQALQCARDTADMQAAIQALAEVAFR